MRLRASLFLPLFVLVSCAVRAQSPAQSQPPRAQIAATSAPVVIPENTPLRVLTTTAISTEHAREGAPLVFSLNQDVVVNGVLIIPRGEMLHGIVVHARQAGRLKGDSHLEIKLTSLDLEGVTYPLYTYRLEVDQSGKGEVTAIDTIGGAEYGTLAGAVVAADKPDASKATKLADIGGGAAVGAGLGALASTSTRGEPAVIPAESQIDFYLVLPIAVKPASAQEAERIASRFHPSEPTLHLRSDIP
ncbi:MAG TPA: hypothetical protein VN612_03035 [Acidobacteriaceae bacterium]|nr:hypothetical protein [Acidobacteriaceae bacterium]